MDDRTLKLLKRQLDIAKEALQQLDAASESQRQHLQSQAALAVTTAQHIVETVRA